jgi:hypothetical protein
VIIGVKSTGELVSLITQSVTGGFGGRSTIFEGGFGVVGFSGDAAGLSDETATVGLSAGPTGRPVEAAAAGLSDEAVVAGVSDEAAAAGLTGEAVATGMSDGAAVVGLTGEAIVAGASDEAAAVGLFGKTAATEWSGATLANSGEAAPLGASNVPAFSEGAGPAEG